MEFLLIDRAEGSATTAGLDAGCWRTWAKHTPIDRGPRRHRNPLSG